MYMCMGHSVLGISSGIEIWCVFSVLSVCVCVCVIQTQRAGYLQWDRRPGADQVGPGSVSAGRLGHLLLLHLERSQVHRKGTTLAPVCVCVCACDCVYVCAFTHVSDSEYFLNPGGNCFITIALLKIE